MTDERPSFTAPPRLPAVLCLHGFSGGPGELQPLTERLRRAGHPVETPLLPGHGGGPGQLAGVDERDWLAAAETALLDLVRRHPRRPVAVAGFSMGGLLALRLARLQARTVSHMVLMATALHLYPAEELLLSALAATVPERLARGIRIPKLRVDVNDAELRSLASRCPGFPLGGLLALRRLARSAMADLPAITAPALIVHGTEDRAVPWQQSLELWQRIGSSEARLLMLERSAHLLALDYDRERLLAAVEAFLTPPPAPAPTQPKIR